MGVIRVTFSVLVVEGTVAVADVAPCAGCEDVEERDEGTLLAVSAFVAAIGAAGAAVTPPDTEDDLSFLEGGVSCSLVTGSGVFWAGSSDTAFSFFFGVAVESIKKYGSLQKEAG